MNLQVYVKNGKNNDNNLKYAGGLETFTISICNNEIKRLTGLLK